MLPLGQAALLSEGTPLARQLLQVDHLGLVGLEQSLVGAIQTLQAGTQLTTGLVLAAGTFSLGEEPLELRHELRGISEQAADIPSTWQARLTRA